MSRAAFRSLRMSVAAALIAATLFVLGPVSSAMAATQWSAASRSTNKQQVPAAVTSSYPYDCTPRSDNPHQSSTVGGVVDGKGWTICRNQRPYEHVDSTLYRQDCWWIFCWWTAVASDSMTWPPTLYTYGTVRSLSIYACNGSASHKYRLDSYHRIVDFDGTGWNSWTSSQEVTLNCG